MRIVHLNSLGCDITDHDNADVGEQETPQGALIRYLGEIGPDCVDEGDTFKVVGE